MASDERLKDLGLLHLQHKPRELAAALDKMLEKYEQRRRRLRESRDKTLQKPEEHQKELNQDGEAPVNASPFVSCPGRPLEAVATQGQAAGAPSGKKA